MGVLGWGVGVGVLGLGVGVGVGGGRLEGVLEKRGKGGASFKGGVGSGEGCVMGGGWGEVFSPHAWPPPPGTTP